MININKAAALLGRHPQTIRDLTRLGKLPATKVGWHWMFNKKQLTELLAIAELIGSTPSKVYLTRKALNR